MSAISEIHQLYQANYEIITKLNYKIKRYSRTYFKFCLSNVSEDEVDLFGF